MVLRNDQTVRQLASEFQKTDDATFAWESLISAYLAMPALRGFWPMSAIGAAPARDLSGSGLDLSQSGIQYGLMNNSIPIANFGVASTDRLYHATDSLFNIDGTETYIISGWRGITLGCWIRHVDFGTNTEVIMSKWDSTTSANRQYLIIVDNSNNIRASIWDGSSAYSIDFTGKTSSDMDNIWRFYCLQWSPSSQDDILRMWVDDEYAELASVGAASLNTGAENFGIGHDYAAGSPQRYFEGQISMAFLCACNAGETAIRRLYYRTRPAFQSRSDW